MSPLLLLLLLFKLRIFNQKKGNDGIEPSTFWLTANCSTSELITPSKFSIFFIEHIGTWTQNPRLKRPSLYHWAICSDFFYFLKNRKGGNRTPVLKFEASYFTTKLLSFILILLFFYYFFFRKNTPYRNPTYVFDVKSRRPSTRRREHLFQIFFSGWKDLNLRSSASKAGTLSQTKLHPANHLTKYFKIKKNHQEKKKKIFSFYFFFFFEFTFFYDKHSK